MGQYLLLYFFKFFGGKFQFRSCKVQIIGAIHRHKVHMCVRHFKTKYADTAPVTIEGLLYGTGYWFSKYQPACKDVITDIKYLIDLNFRHYQYMPFPHRENIKEGVKKFVLRYLIRGDVACNDL